jgi:hypothetical protein
MAALIFFLLSLVTSSFKPKSRLEAENVLGGAAAWPLSARAQQQERMRRVGVLTTLTADDPEERARTSAFREALAQMGWNLDQGRCR